MEFASIVVYSVFFILFLGLILFSYAEQLHQMKNAKKLFNDLQKIPYTDENLLNLREKAQNIKDELRYISKKRIQKEMDYLIEFILNLDKKIKNRVKNTLKIAEQHISERNYSAASKIIDSQQTYLDILKDEEFANEVESFNHRIEAAKLEDKKNEIKNKIKHVDNLLKLDKFNQASKLLEECQVEADALSVTEIKTKIFAKIKLVKAYKKLSELFRISKRIKLDDLANIMQMSRTDLIDNIIDWNSVFDGLMIDGDELVLSDNSNIDGFVNLLDNQYATWNNKEKFGTGKKI